MKLKTLILDNHDSFTYNLYQYCGELGGNPVVKTNDSISLQEIKTMKPTHIVLSPGPGTPENPNDIGICEAVIETFSEKIPILGVCLGHQAIIHYFGGKIGAAPQVMHGKKSEIQHDGKGIFHQLENPITVMRYHSLMGEKKSLPNCLEITAMSAQDEVIMGIRHKIYPIEGVQFHPESIGTPAGKKMLKNFLTRTPIPNQKVTMPEIPSPFGF